MTKENPKTYSDKKLRDIVMKFVIERRDSIAITFSWLSLFFLKNPQEKKKIFGGSGNSHGKQKLITQVYNYIIYIYIHIYIYIIMY